jgi:hypothetical protein
VTLMRPCMDCGELTDIGPRCDACRPVASRARERARTSRDRGTFRERGYDSRWTYLSQRARRLQPWCSHCGALRTSPATTPLKRGDGTTPASPSDCPISTFSAGSVAPAAGDRAPPSTGDRPGLPGRERAAGGDGGGGVAGPPAAQPDGYAEPAGTRSIPSSPTPCTKRVPADRGEPLTDPTTAALAAVRRRGVTPAHRVRPPAPRPHDRRQVRCLCWSALGAVAAQAPRSS